MTLQEYRQLRSQRAQERPLTLGVDMASQGPWQSFRDVPDGVVVRDREGDAALIKRGRFAYVDLPTQYAPRQNFRRDNISWLDLEREDRSYAPYAYECREDEWAWPE